MVNSLLDLRKRFISYSSFLNARITRTPVKFSLDKSVFHLNFLLGIFLASSLSFFFNKSIIVTLYFFNWLEKISICGNHFQYIENLLFSPGIQQGDDVQSCFNHPRLLGEGNHLLKKSGRDMLPVHLTDNLPTFQVRYFSSHIGVKIVLPLRHISPLSIRKGYAVKGVIRPVFQRQSSFIGFFFHIVPPLVSFCRSPRKGFLLHFCDVFRYWSALTPAEVFLFRRSFCF